ncbi:unnamed protein product [Brassicogethes aeneus]|uniref:RAD50-interacting protein 1 n=1 Tax=Brassicogethes aeneus TaxID=1431903 RepID=A0A9P0BIV9_BRAAE|nr:unnamed protein product [Brassicogethes aeneus]
MDSEAKSRILSELNEKYGRDFIDPVKCRQIFEELQKRRLDLENRLDVKNTEHNLGQTVQRAESLIIQCDSATENAREIVEKINKDLDEIDEVRKETKIQFYKLNTLQCTLQYMRVIQQIEFLSEELQKEVGKKDDEKCATIFANLCEISRNLADLPATHLRSYLKETLHFWHNVLKEKLAKDFDDILIQIKWPFVNTNFSLVIPLQANVQKLQIIAEYLLQIELPSESTGPIVTSSLLAEYPPLCLPIQLLISPLRKRFVYHFFGTRQTNRPDKPEWYFTQILTWIRDHREFVGKWIQPVIDKLGLHHIDAKLELTSGLVQLAIEKLCVDLPQLQYDDFTFSHTIDEALGFDKELREMYNYPSNQPSVVSVLTQAQVFIKWLTMEKKYATEKMDAILSSSIEAFEPIASDVEDIKVTTCADAFITLQQTITERYEALPQPGHRLQFLDLQLELFDDFRVRLLQLVNAVEGDIIDSVYPMITNTLFYIENVLIDWGAMLHYLNLFYYKTQFDNAPKTPNSSILHDFDDSPSDSETETVFADALSLYRHMRKDLVCTLSEFVIMEVKSKSKGYRRERWNAIPLEKEYRSLSLTPSACPMFEVIAKRLHQLQKSLESKLFTIIWRSIAQHLDTFLFEDLILDNRFTMGGALQLKFDIMRNLLPLFSQFSMKPENYFTQVIEATNLLNITKGSALLLRETLLALEGATGVEDTRGKALKEVGVTQFTPKMSIKILNQRTDITVNRIDVD